MARKTIITLIDDTDGTEAAETIAFALDGKTYEIDLSENNAEKLRRNLRQWTDRARTSGRPTRSRQRLAAVGHPPM